MTPPHRPAALLVLALTAWLTVDAVQRPAFADEANWITSSALTYRLVTEMAPPSTWERAYAERKLGDWGALNPPLVKCYIGAVLAAAGYRDPLPYWYDWLQTPEWNDTHGRYPPPRGALLAARLAVVLCSGLCLWLVYWCAWRLTASPWAIVAPFLGLTSVFRYHGAQVFTDTPELACLLASGLCLITYVERPNGRSVFWSAIWAGLACSVKFSAGQAVISLALATIWMGGKERVPQTCVALLLPWAVFVALNPFLYPAPLFRTVELAFAWHLVKQAQQQFALIAPEAVTSRLHALWLVLRFGVIDPFGSWLALVTVPLALLGAWTWRSRAWAILFLPAVALTVLWLPFEWSRYYLPVLIWTPPLIVVGLARCARLVTALRPVPQTRYEHG